MKLISIINEIDKVPVKKFVKATTVSDNAVNLIKDYEGFSASAYRDVDGNMVIGHGTRLPDSTYLDKKITKLDAHQLVKNHLVKNVVPVIKKYVKRSMNQNQWDALASLVYNIGENNFRKSKLLVSINDGNLKEIKKNWSEWRVAGGKVSQGLIKRRQKEITHFFS